MPAMTVTITDKTQTPRSIYDLAVKGTGGGYTVVGGMPSLNVGASVCFLGIQAGAGNSSSLIYKGDSGVKNDGTCQGRELKASEVSINEAVQYSVNLQEIFVTGNANSITFNVEWHL